MEGEPFEEPAWRLCVLPTALEAGGVFHAGGPPRGRRIEVAASIPDADRSAVEGARRAKTKVRRYAAANRLNRLGTLTYAGGGCHDQSELRADLGRFFKALRKSLGTKLPYVWVPEWHKTDHGLHAHVAVGRYIKRTCIEEAWPHGFVHIKLLGDLRAGSGPIEQARLGARYLSKYITKAFDDRRISHRHRYDIAQGFQPREVSVQAYFFDEAVEMACQVLGRGLPDYVWKKDSDRDKGVPAMAWMAWRG